jgi:tetratricopeptide (TPR) repeat protein
MRVGQGWSSDPASDASAAHGVIAHALDLEPSHSLSLAMDGLVCAYIRKDLTTAMKRYDDALRSNPSEALGWLFRSACQAYEERGDDAVQDALYAQRLSPLDPLRYYYDNFTSTAMLARGDLHGAIEYGRRSLRANKMHGPTLRILAIAHELAGEGQQARQMVIELLRLEPGFTVGKFRARYPGQGTVQVDRYAKALRAAGLAD